METEINVSKDGIEWLLMCLYWTKEGLKMDVKVDDRVEEYFKTLTKNYNPVPVSNYGGQEWDLSKGDLESYYVQDGVLPRTRTFMLGYPGFPLHMDNYPNKVNLSFMHLVGASKGIQLTTKIPVSPLGKKDLKAKLESGMDEFVREYLTFGKMVIRIFSTL